MARFVILEHDHPTLHWDLMLEADGVLTTWRLPAPPSEHPREALAIGAHRLAYLDYEGPVSGERGTVKRWDAGDYETVQRTPGHWTVRLRGKVWRGLVKMREGRDSVWTFEFSSDSNVSKN